MYRGSAARILVERGLGSKPPQKPQKGDCIHSVDYLRRHCMWKVALSGGCPSKVLGGLLRKTAVSRGDVRLKSGGHLLLFLLTAAVGVQKTET